MELSGFQEKVYDLTHHWTDATPEGIMLLLTEELGELAQAVRRLGRKRWGHDGEAVGSRDDVTEEAGDVLFLLARICLITGVDLSEAADRVLGKIERRLSHSTR